MYPYVAGVIYGGAPKQKVFKMINQQKKFVWNDGGVK